MNPETIAIRAGTVIDYRLRLIEISFRWRTLLESFEPERRFVDIQISGPYQSWRHTHEFTEIPEGTLIQDQVEYSLPLGSLGDVFGRFLPGNRHAPDTLTPLAPRH